MSSNDSSGCFATIAVILGAIGFLLLLGQGCKKLGHEYREDPGSVITVIFLLAGGATLLYYATRKSK